MSESYCACGWRVVTPVPINEMPVDIVCAQCGAQIHEGIPADELPWPAWARSVEYWWRRPSHSGVGDSFERMATFFGAKPISQFLEKHGIDCGCGDRKAWMNRKYSYDTKPLKQDLLASYDGIAPGKRPNLMITVATGLCYKYYNIVRPSLEHYADKIDADLICLVNSTTSWWGYEKFRVQQFVPHYERTLFVDTDLVITPNCPNVFDMVPIEDVGIHNDWDWQLHKNWLWDLKREVCESQGWNYLHIEALLNTGFVVCSRHHELWKPPEKPIPNDHCSEQFYVEQRIVREGYSQTHLPIEMNVQWWMPEFRRLLPIAQVVHLANSTSKIKDLTEAMDKYFYNYSTRHVPDFSRISSRHG